MFGQLRDKLSGFVNRLIKREESKETPTPKAEEKIIETPKPAPVETPKPAPKPVVAETPKPKSAPAPEPEPAPAEMPKEAEPKKTNENCRKQL